MFYAVWGRNGLYRIVRYVDAMKTDIAAFDDVHLATTICAELNQAVMHGRITRKESPMPKNMKPVASPTIRRIAAGAAKAVRKPRR